MNTVPIVHLVKDSDYAGHPMSHLSKESVYSWPVTGCKSGVRVRIYTAFHKPLVSSVVVSWWFIRMSILFLVVYLWVQSSPVICDTHLRGSWYGTIIFSKWSSFDYSECLGLGPKGVLLIWSSQLYNCVAAGTCNMQFSKKVIPFIPLITKSAAVSNCHSSLMVLQ